MGLARSASTTATAPKTKLTAAIRNLRRHSTRNRSMKSTSLTGSIALSLEITANRSRAIRVARRLLTSARLTATCAPELHVRQDCGHATALQGAEHPAWAVVELRCRSADRQARHSGRVLPRLPRRLRRLRHGRASRLAAHLPDLFA